MCKSSTLIVLFGVLLFNGAMAKSVSAAVSFEGLPEKAVFPADNLYSEAKDELGKQLYFDKRLSLDGTVSCNSCHNVLKGGEDNLSFSPGVNGKLGGRSSPTVWSAAFQSVQFWDGRAATLEAQAIGPLVNPVEMAMPNHDTVVERLKKIPGYQSQFAAVFGAYKTITIDLIAKAIATYERTLITPNSPFDKFTKGDAKAISAQAKRGLKLVQSVGCLSCHGGSNFSGPTLPLGQGFYHKFPLIPNTDYDKKYAFSRDLGRFEVTKAESDKNSFRVPTWRNIALTAPYFHNGSVATLDEAVNVMAKTQLNRDLTKTETKDIVAFLQTLTGQFPKQSEPVLPETPKDVRLF